MSEIKAFFVGAISLCGGVWLSFFHAGIGCVVSLSVIGTVVIYLLFEIRDSVKRDPAE